MSFVPRVTCAKVCCCDTCDTCFCVTHPQVAQLFRELQQERDNVNLVSLPDVGHCPHDDRPELAASHILPWLSSLDSADL